ncbi:hypothetical protein ACQKMV_17155, partial [Lysinibacillus sp. NPDC094403]|uniref:hypothetical protein n=1 Tax=Lysinibacillus sp. NPDC094403 TaxID=3390581 RepID=UPI003D029A9E
MLSEIVDLRSGWATSLMISVTDETLQDVFCAKAKHQQQMFSARKQSGSDKCFLRESKAAATNVSCAKAKRQRQMFSARKQSGSDKCFLRESKAAA